MLVFVTPFDSFPRGVSTSPRTLTQIGSPGTWETVGLVRPRHLATRERSSVRGSSRCRKSPQSSLWATMCPLWTFLHSLVVGEVGCTTHEWTSTFLPYNFLNTSMKSGFDKKYLLSRIAFILLGPPDESLSFFLRSLSGNGTTVPSGDPGVDTQA